MVLAISTLPPFKDTSPVDTLALSDMRSCWAVVANGTASSDAMAGRHVVVCPALAKAHAGDRATLTVNTSGQLVVRINDAVVAVDAPPPGVPPMPPVSADAEVYALVSFGDQQAAKHMEAVLHGTAGTGISFEEQARRRQYNKLVAAALARGQVFGSRLVADAVAAGDAGLLRVAVERVLQPNASLGPNNPRSPLGEAILCNILPSIRTLLCASGQQPFPPNTVAEETDTGQVSAHTFNHRVGNIGAARGGKEGTRALVAWTGQDALEESRLASQYPAFLDALRQPEVVPATIEYMLHCASDFATFALDRGLHTAAAAGNVVAAEALLHWILPKGVGLNKLHLDATTTTQGPVVGKLQARSVTKKASGNYAITPLHLACINPNVEVLAQFLGTGASPEEADKLGRRPLHFAAAAAGDGAAVSLLLRHGADPFGQDKEGVEPLALALRHGRDCTARLLLEACTRKLKERAVVATPAAASTSKKQKTAKTSKSAPADSTGFDGVRKDRLGQTVMHYAAHFGSAAIMQALLDAGGQANAVDGEKFTPLITAARAGNAATVGVLLARDDVSRTAVTNRGYTALHHAAKNGHFDVCQMLLRAGLLVNAADSSGHTVSLCSPSWEIRLWVPGNILLL